jgi:hypothetical protein
MRLFNGTFMARSFAPTSLHGTSTSAMKQVFRDADSRISVICSDLTGTPEQLATSTAVKKYAVADRTENLAMIVSAAVRQHQSQAFYPGHRLLPP